MVIGMMGMSEHSTMTISMSYERQRVCRTYTGNIRTVCT